MRRRWKRRDEDEPEVVVGVTDAGRSLAQSVDKLETALNRASVRWPSAEQRVLALIEEALFERGVVSDR